MKISFDNALGMHPQALKLRARRTEILASNLANADTPGYKSRDFDIDKLLRQSQGETLPLRTTRQEHIKTPKETPNPACSTGYPTKPVSIAIPSRNTSSRPNSPKTRFAIRPVYDSSTARFPV